jgi:hypothetical protein
LRTVKPSRVTSRLAGDAGAGSGMGCGSVLGQHADPLPVPAGRGSLTALWYELVQLRPKHHTLLLIWIGPRPDEEHRRLAPVDRHME